MSYIQNIVSVGRDDRVRKYLMPKRIVAVNGDVNNAEGLLREKSLQISLSEPDVTTLKNGGSGTEPAWILLDYGCELHGGVRILASRTGGAMENHGLRITFGESVSEALSQIGEKNATNDHAIRDFTMAVPTLSDQTYGETGFRFVKLELVGEKSILTLKSALAVFIYREEEYKGSFTSSDETINRIYDTAAYTVHLNMQYMLWDGIKRDRLAWVGDSHPEMLAIRTLFGCDPILPDNLRFSREEAPLPRWMNGMPAYSLWWLMMTYDWCTHFGDFSFAEESADYIRGLVEQFCALIDDDGDHHLPAYFLDWPTNGHPEAKAGVHGLMILALEKGRKLCLRLGFADTAAKAEAKLAALRKVCPDGGDRSQANAMLALSGVGGEREIESILKKGAAGLSTYMGYYILTALAKAGHTAEAIGIMKEYYGGMLSVGATSFWEDFDLAWLEIAGRIDEMPTEGKKDIHGDYGKFCYVGLRHSLCHGWSAGVVAFMAENILGIRAQSEGCDDILLAPELGPLDFAEGSYPTRHGILTVRVHRVNGRPSVEKLTVPEGVRLTLAPGVGIG